MRFTDQIVKPTLYDLPRISKRTEILYRSLLLNMNLGIGKMYRKKRQKIAVSFLVCLALTVAAPAQTPQSYVPNDPGTLANMAAVNAVGLPTGWAKINALRASGKRRVRVVVCDTGIDNLHHDLSGKVVDRQNFTTDVVDPFNPDNNGHGTQMTSIIAATGDNHEGMAGVVYQPDPSQLNLEPDIELLDYKVLDSHNEMSTTGPLVNAFRTIKAKIDSGFEIDVVNCSLAGSGSSELKQATSDLVQAGVLISAAGAAEVLGPQQVISPEFGPFPAGYPGVVSVSGMDGNKLLSTAGLGASIGAEGLNVPADFPMNIVGGAAGTVSNNSPATALISGTLAAIWAYRLDVSDRKTAVDLLFSGTRHVDGLKSVIQGGRVLDVGAVMNAPLPPPPPTPAPEITLASRLAPKKLGIEGNNFNAAPRVTLNGEELTDYIVNSDSHSIILQGKVIKKRLNNNPQLFIQVMSADGKLSNIFILNL